VDEWLSEWKRMGMCLEVVLLYFTFSFFFLNTSLLLVSEEVFLSYADWLAYMDGMMDHGWMEMGWT